MNEQKKTKGAKWFGIPNLVPYMRPYGKLIFWMVLMAFYGSAMDAVIPLFQQYAIDHYIADSTLAGLGWFIGAYVVVILTQTASNYISAFGACKLELSVGRDLKRESFNHLQTLSFSYFNQNSVGYVHARVMSDTDRIASTLAWSMAEGVWHSAYLVCAIVMMLILNWKMALCVLVIVPIVAISSMYFQKKLVFFHRQVREKNSRITGAFNEGITGATTTKTLVVEDKMEKEFDELTADMKKVSVRAMHFRAIFISTTTLAASLALALVLWRGGIVTREGVMLIGTLTVASEAQGASLVVTLAIVASFILASLFFLPFDEESSVPGYRTITFVDMPTTSAQDSSLEKRCVRLVRRCKLSPREAEVLTWAAQGRNAKAIAEKLFISESTTKTHMSNIYRKAGIHSQQELIALLDQER